MQSRINGSRALEAVKPLIVLIRRPEGTPGHGVGIASALVGGSWKGFRGLLCVAILCEKQLGRVVRFSF